MYSVEWKSVAKQSSYSNKMNIDLDCVLCDSRML